MSVIPDKCSRCGAPIDWEKGASSTKCSFCGKTNYLKNNFLNQFKSNFTLNNSKKILLNPISLCLIILLPVVFNRLIIQANKYKRFASAYLAEKACEEDESKLRAKELKVRCDYQEKNTVRLISYENKVINYKLSGETKKNIENNFLKSIINKSDEQIKNERYCNYDLKEKKGGILHKKYTDQINKYISDEEIIRKDNLKWGFRYNQSIAKLDTPLNKWGKEVIAFYNTQNNLKEIDYPLDEWGLQIYENSSPKWNLHYLLPRLKVNYPYLLPRLKEKYPYLNYPKIYGLPSYYSVKESRQRKIDWLEDFISKRNEEFAWDLIKLDHSKRINDCLKREKSNDIGKLKLIITKSSAMKKCDKELTKQEKLFISKDNYRSSVNCVHPYLGKYMSKYSGSVFPEFETNFTNLKELKEDIFMAEKIGTLDQNEINKMKDNFKCLLFE